MGPLRDFGMKKSEMLQNIRFALIIEHFLCPRRNAFFLANPYIGMLSKHWKHAVVFIRTEALGGKSIETVSLPFLIKLSK